MVKMKCNECKHAKFDASSTTSFVIRYMCDVIMMPTDLESECWLAPGNFEPVEDLNTSGG